jgi:PST family polysaccharide transporter
VTKLKYFRWHRLIPSSLLQKLQGRKHLQNIISNTGWLFADRILRMGLGLVVMVMVARYLGVQQFGTFNFAVAFLGLFSHFSTLGLPSLSIRTLTHDPANKNQILGTVFVLQLLGGIATLILSVFAIFIFRHDNPLIINIVFVLATIGIFHSFDSIDYWFQSQVQSKYTVLAKNSAFIILALIQIILINARAPLIAFAFARLAESMLSAIGLIFAYKIQGYSIRLWRWSMPLAKSLLHESWPLILSTLGVVIYMRIDQVMLGQMIGVKDVGLYSSATRISEVWYFIPTALVSSLSPTIYAAKKNSSTAIYLRQTERLLSLLSLMAIILAIPMSFFSSFLVNRLFGNDFIGAGQILAIHIWAALFVFIGAGSSPWFISEGLTSLIFRRTIMGAVINIVLNFWLIPAHGGVGAAIATVVSQAYASFLANAFHSDTRQIFKVQLRSLNFFSSLRKVFY